MTARLDLAGVGPFLPIAVTAVVLTAWQVEADRSVFERYFGPIHPTAVVAAAALLGAVGLEYLQGVSDFGVIRSGTWAAPVRLIAWTVPSFAAVAIVADIALRYPIDTNVRMPDSLRFYPVIAVVVEIALHVVPVALLVALVGAPAKLDAAFWRIAFLVALIEALLQAAYASTVGTAAFSAIHLTAFGVLQVWMFLRFGFVWMLGFRLAYYSIWHVAWGAARLKLLF